jgi:hypothetical protein
MYDDTYLKGTVTEVKTVPGMYGGVKHQITVVGSFTFLSDSPNGLNQLMKERNLPDLESLKDSTVVLEVDVRHVAEMPDGVPAQTNGEEHTKARRIYL